MHIHPIIILISLYIALGLLLGLEGKKKKIGFFLSFLLSMLLTPLIAMFFVMFSKRSYPKRKKTKEPIDL